MDTELLNPLCEWINLHCTLLWVYRGAPLMMQQDAGITPGDTAWLLESGHVQIHIGANSMDVDAGNWILIPRGALRFSFSHDARILSIHYQTKWMSGTSLFEHDAPLTIEADKVPSLTSLGRAIERYIHKKFPGAESKLMLQRCDLETYLRLQMMSDRWALAVVQLMKRLKHKPTRNKPIDPRIAEAMRIIQLQITSRPFIERDLPQLLSISPSHLDRMFLKELGITPRMYADEARYNAACHWLANSTELSKQIASKLGFAQPAHFSLWFRKRSGLTPEEFRKRQKRRPKGDNMQQDNIQQNDDCVRHYFPVITRHGTGEEAEP